MIQTAPLSVSQINFYIKNLFDADSRLFNVLIAGEISNFTNHYRSGHFYFTLKDDSSAIKAVMFARSAQRVRFVPENGMRVVCKGRVGVFERDGIYQLYVDDMQPEGAGALALAFEQLKKKLSSEGLFDETRKKSIPRFPKNVGVITSDTGAAVRDICNVLTRRYPLCTVKIYPVNVQGASCASDNIKAIRYFNKNKSADVIILGRGGGSIEDLWGYNEEKLVRAVAESEIPIITGIGHETDFTLCDFAADLRAPTPSAAAELASEDTDSLKYAVFNLRSRADSAFARVYSLKKQSLDSAVRILRAYSPQNIYSGMKEAFDNKIKRLNDSVSVYMFEKERRLDSVMNKLYALNPLNSLKKGFFPVYSGDKRVMSASAVNAGDELKIMTFDGTIMCRAQKILYNAVIADEKNDL
ncbi:MAG: exodeoxyribonuclease VII large subunit [Oscillospiraceae bacterium]|nr:exodeoxyribonuclease VII large subunit [Oscillospiraceae bacterium]MDY3938517.1 exodeoxyribonuclease VII large subunit [Oscillospiraceae bacterium]